MPRPCALSDAGRRADHPLHHPHRCSKPRRMCCARPRAWPATSGIRSANASARRSSSQQRVRRDHPRAGSRLPPCDRPGRAGAHRRPGRHRQELHHGRDPRGLRGARLQGDRPRPDQRRRPGHAAATALRTRRTIHSELFSLNNGRTAMGQPHRRHGGRGRHDRHAN